MSAHSPIDVGGTDGVQGRLSRPSRSSPRRRGCEWYQNVQIPPDEPPPTEEELELEREMEYFVEPEEAVGPRGMEPAE